LASWENPWPRNLLKAGYELVVLDLNKAAVAELVALGAESSETPSELARKTKMFAEWRTIQSSLSSTKK
jgi:3-hydroxyisobutyrate dehydrogenase-like beta-hydroxyacid dehydrogenase